MTLCWTPRARAAATRAAEAVAAAPAWKNGVPRISGGFEAGVGPRNEKRVIVSVGARTVSPGEKTATEEGEAIASDTASTADGAKAKLLSGRSAQLATDRDAAATSALLRLGANVIVRL